MDVEDILPERFAITTVRPAMPPPSSAISTATSSGHIYEYGNGKKLKATPVILNIARRPSSSEGTMTVMNRGGRGRMGGGGSPLVLPAPVVPMAAKTRQLLTRREFDCDSRSQPKSQTISVAAFRRRTDQEETEAQGGLSTARRRSAAARKDGEGGPSSGGVLLTETGGVELSSSRVAKGAAGDERRNFSSPILTMRPSSSLLQEKEESLRKRSLSRSQKKEKKDKEGLRQRHLTNTTTTASATSNQQEDFLLFESPEIGQKKETKIARGEEGKADKKKPAASEKTRKSPYSPDFNFTVEPGFFHRMAISFLVLCAAPELLGKDFYPSIQQVIEHQSQFPPLAE